jgi:hypothetical protein
VKTMGPGKSRTARIGSYLITLVLMGAAFLIMAGPGVQVAHAYSNTVTAKGSATGTSVSSFTISSSSVTAGDLLVLMIQTTGGTIQNNKLYPSAGPYASSVTDITGDSWTTINSEDANPGYQSAYTSFTNPGYGPTIQVWYASALSSSTGTITVTLSGSASTYYANVLMGDSNTLGVYGVMYFSATGICTNGITYGSNPPASGSFECVGTAGDIYGPSTVSFSHAIPSNSLVIGQDVSTFCAYAGNSNPSISVPSPFIRLVSSQSGGCGAGGSWNQQMIDWAYFTGQTTLSTSITVSQGTISGTYFSNPNGWVQKYTCTVNLVTSTCLDYDGFVNGLYVIFTVGGSTFTQGGTQQIGCSFNPIANASTHYVSLTGNQTWFYYGQSTVGQLFFNLTVYVHAISVTSNRHLSLIIFTNPNQNAISVSNPLVQKLIYTWNLPTTGGPQKFSIAPQVDLPNSGQYAYAVSADHSGVTLFQGNTGLIMYPDSVDGYAAASINALPSPAATPACMFGIIAIPTTATTVTTGGSGGTGTATVTVTSYYSNCSSDPSACSQSFLANIISYLPFIFLSLVLGAMFKVPGLIFGMALGSIIEVGMGVFPVWVIAIVVFGIFMFIWKGR